MSLPVNVVLPPRTLVPFPQNEKGIGLLDLISGIGFNVAHTIANQHKSQTVLLCREERSGTPSAEGVMGKVCGRIPVVVEPGHVQTKPWGYPE